MRQRIVMHPAEQKRQARKRLVKVARKLEWALDQIIAALDEIDGDPDLEPDLGSVTTAPYQNQRDWAQGVNDNREHDPAEDRLFDESEWEPSLGEPEGRVNQLGWGKSGTRDLEADHDGREPEVEGNWIVTSHDDQTDWKG
ncbi:hypothetical protein [Asticcacaulis sp. EMRT-3]|uniref:hypothetical protein n=1 Tax=Asticcacaulis sp. EMRT-3 TaxID=3040349 RepID=UPI0024AF88E3|nr:hypothetical protein [Asticcacaulis sp. EMRT-3]MDI7775515.1 hypothetical protein [Asticcacaulis sp. EMRT-3]